MSDLAAERYGSAPESSSTFLTMLFSRVCLSHSPTLVLLALSLCCAIGCKEVTETVVEKGVKAAKNAAKGVEEGVDKGRKEGQSADDAIIVSRNDDLTGSGTISLVALRKVGTTGVELEIAFENTTTRPLRITNLEIIALDKDGFVQRPSSPPAGLTVPPKAKDKLVVSFNGAASTLATARIWGKDYTIPAIK